MFGQNNTSGFGGTGAFRQNTQQQSGGLFGSNTSGGGGLFGNQNTNTGGFGQNTTNSSLFGSGTGLFGNNNTQNQQSATPAFGNTSGGLFGQQNNSMSATPAFGSNNNNTGGLFGGVGSNNAFGNTSNTNTAFGSQNNNTGGTSFFGNRPSTGFGSNTGGGLFGNSSATTPAFGNTGGFNSTNAAGAVTTGTMNPSYSVTSEKDPQSNGMNHFQCISCMPAYRNYSLEELRLQDYNQGRRNNSTAPATTGFGQPSTTTTTTGFGGSNLFGNTNSTNTTTPFGANTTASNTGTGNLFGGGTTGAFGQKATPAFGGSNAPGTGTTGTGLFGQTNTTGGGLFGGNTNTAFGQKPATSAFGSGGGFGTNTGTTGGLFGANNTANQANTGTTGAFGSGGFGSNTTNTFGNANAANNTAGTTTGGTGLFGFGANANTNNAATTNTQPSTGFGTGNTGFSFGQNAAANTSKPGGFSFGAANTTTPAATTGFSFGQNNAAANKPATTGLFGNTAKPAGTGLFGGATTGGTTGTGLFGNTAANTNTTAGTGGGLFGNAGATTTPSLFGNNAGAGNVAATGLQNKPATTTPSLFGNTANTANTTAPNVGLFGNTSTVTQPTTFGSGGLFGNNAQPAQNQQPLVASIDQNPYGNNPLFSTASGQAPAAMQEPIASPLSTKSVPKKSASLPQFWLSPRSSSNAKLASIATFTGANVLKSTVLPPKQKSLHLFESLNDDLFLKPDAFAPRQNVKKLVIDRKHSDKSLLQGVSNAPEPSLKLLPASHTSESSSSESKTQKAAELHDDYWMSPSLQDLLSYSEEQLRAVHQFAVGRKGYGKVQFLKPVDLSAFASLERIPGEVVVFEKKICSVYPDGQSPPLNEGLNVPAIITLENAWPLSRETREPIKDTQNPRYVQHINRLKKMRDTEFIEFKDGNWIFKVQHFSKYGLLDDEDEDEDEENTEERVGQNEPKKYGQNLHQVNETDDVYLTHLTPGAFPVQTSQAGTQTHYQEPSFIRDSFGPEDTFTFKKPKLHNEVIKPLVSDNYEPNITFGYSSEMLDATDEKKSTSDASDAEVESEMNVSESSSSASEHYESEHSFASSLTGSSLYSPSENDVPVSDAGVAVVDEDYQSESPLERGLIRCDTWVQQLEHNFQRATLLLSKNISSSVPRDDPVRGYDSSALEKDIFNDDDEGSVMRPWLAFDEKPLIVNPTVRWLPGNKAILVNKRSINFVQNMTKSTVSSPSLLPMLTVQYHQTEIMEDILGVPIASTRPSLYANELSKRSTGEESTAWKLCSILFDPKRYDFPDDLDEESSFRLQKRIDRETLSEWLTSEVKEYIMDAYEKCNDPEQRIFILLTGNQIERACEEAIATNNKRLATVIPMANSDLETQAELRQQIDEWKSRGDLPYVTKYTRLIFELLSGNTGFAEGVEDGVENVYISEGLPWKVAFGLKLWYNVDISIQEAMALYISDLETYGDRLKSPIETSPDGIQYSDMFFELLQLYSFGGNLEDVVTARLSSGERCDERLIWQLLMYLGRSHSICDFSDRLSAASLDESGLLEMDVENDVECKPISVLADQITKSFASALENCDEWGWSVFVLLHEENAQSRKADILDCLARNVPNFSEESKQRLEAMHIPTEWVNEALALYARYERDYVNEVRFLQTAGLFEEAQKRLLLTIAPQAVISSEFADLEVLLDNFSEVADGLAGWCFGGQVYKDYVYLVRNYNTLRADEFQTVLRRLLMALPEVPTVTLVQRAAVEKMAYFTSEANALSGNGPCMNLPLPSEGRALSLRCSVSSAFD
ncbi:nucleoporin Nup189 [Schizosaccharomyces japonicus yFS275]|uniref:Nucleoporin Nup189 n=1 Tax=Schizosaccharomyces japonicus (strain yFS275 / FY16936) TaxID=402676 RepID=B6K3V7_SCHJY|nr:nucleoporin Nup189 [Schizosaccharomyces japonicus yFS275]EEB08164.1 nucleoporin Nup189 [Schizosaccharomyces japonicus yFS275]